MILNLNASSAVQLMISLKNNEKYEIIIIKFANFDVFPNKIEVILSLQNKYVNKIKLTVWSIQSKSAGTVPKQPISPIIIKTPTKNSNTPISSFLSELKASLRAFSQATTSFVLASIDIFFEYCLFKCCDDLVSDISNWTTIFKIKFKIFNKV